jgi:hypothetical protein
MTLAEFSSLLAARGSRPTGRGSQIRPANPTTERHS